MMQKILAGLVVLVLLIMPLIYWGGYRAGKTATEARTIEKVVYIQSEAVDNTKQLKKEVSQLREKIKNAENKNKDCFFVLNFDVFECLQ